MAKPVLIGDGMECPKCNRAMGRYEHKEIKEKQLNQPFYFTYWDKCKPCRHMQHYEDAKVWNRNAKALEVNAREKRYREYQRFDRQANQHLQSIR